MKRMAAFFLSFLVSSFALAVDFEFLGYLRGGTGLNLEGGLQECFFNSGIPSNFMRLGNECGFYSELGIVFHHKRAGVGDPTFFKTNTRYVFQAKGRRQWEDASTRDSQQLEAFVSAGGFADLPGNVWVGKRFYRDVDLHIFDWYYYGDMSGIGAGMDNIHIKGGKFSVAHLIQVNDSLTTDVGRPVLQAIDLRWHELPSYWDQKLNLWGVVAWAPSSSAATTQYSATQGVSLASRFQGPLKEGNNNFTLMYGRGAMKDFNIYSTAALAQKDEGQKNAWTIRAIEDWHHDVSIKWGLMLGAAIEFANNGAATNSRRSWQEIGVRPIYYVSDRFQWVFEAGFSHINNEAELQNGSPLGDRNLTRLSVSSQISMSRSIWGRPVLRAFLAHSLWNGANQKYIGLEAPTFGDKMAGTAFGYQFEAWF